MHVLNEKLGHPPFKEMKNRKLDTLTSAGYVIWEKITDEN